MNGLAGARGESHASAVLGADGPDAMCLCAGGTRDPVHVIIVRFGSSQHESQGTLYLWMDGRSCHRALW